MKVAAKRRAWVAAFTGSANATAACYVKLEDARGQVVHGVGMDPNIVMASLKAVLSGVQRMMAASAA